MKLSAPEEKPAKKTPESKKKRRTAEDFAKKQQDISISEFFRKNRHLLGFDNPTKALLTTVKEAVDNALDACEEARILPEIDVAIERISEDRFRIVVIDNGPGIVRAQIPKIFGKLLYGSKFHACKMSRGQQGIGISAAGMYGQMTTGKPSCITSRIASAKNGAHYYEILINAKKNKPEIIKDELIEWDRPHGTKIEMEMEARYTRGARSVDDYLKQTAIANPHIIIRYNPPNGAEPVVFERATADLPVEPKEIKPHPHGVELGVLIEMMRASKAPALPQFFRKEFSRVTEKVCAEICEKAGISDRIKPSRIKRADAEKLFRAIGEVKIMAPPTSCISPIGEELILEGLKKEINADFYTTTTRPPRVYRGNPFQIEAALAWGGNLPEDGLARIMRFANRVPLMYQQSACAIYKSVLSTDWRNYRITQNRGALPGGPLLVLVHVASVWVPFTSESKEAIAHYPEIIKEMKLALQECGRRLGIHLSRRRREAEEQRKRSHIELYIPHICEALQEILGFSDREKERSVEKLRGILERSRKP
jgi:DNA topoisomerase-6 subunit B